MGGFTESNPAPSLPCPQILKSDRERPIRARPLGPCLLMVTQKYIRLECKGKVDRPLRKEEEKCQNVRKV